METKEFLGDLLCHSFSKRPVICTLKHSTFDIEASINLFIPGKFGPKIRYIPRL